MRVSGLTAGGDWTFGRSKANYKTRSAAIRQNIVTRLRSFKNDYFADINAGGDWFTIFGQRGNKDQILREVERIVLQTEGVRAIKRLEIVATDSNRRVTIALEYVDLFDQSYVEQVAIL
jgi:hypothetical protein